MTLVESRFGLGQAFSWRSDLAGLRARYRQLLTSRDEHLRLVTAEHPTIKAIEQQIADTSQQIEQLQDRCVGACLAMLRQQYLDAEQRQEQLSTSLERKQQQIGDLNKTMVRYAMLRSEYEQAKRLSEALTERIREVDMAEDAGAMNIKVLELARPALRPSRPQTLKVIAIASLLGVVIGVIGAVWRESTDDKIHDLDQIKTLSCGPILGIVPAVSRRKGRAIRSSVFTSRAPAAFTEALAFLSARLYTTGKDGQHKIIQIASALPAEGVSTVTGQLGMAMARHGLNVLIVDANWSYPSAYRIIGQGTSTDGLLAVLAGKARLSRAIRGVGIPRLSLLPAGSWPDGQPVVSVRLVEMVLTRLALHYDQILIDSPPVAACADAQLVAGCCKAWMLVVRPGRCTARALRYAQQVLGLPGRHCIGIVVNRVKLGRRYRFESPCGYIRKRMASGGNGPTRPDHAYQRDRPAGRLAQIIGQQ